jgi:branched-chain amino acid transport system permease protein
LFLEVLGESLIMGILLGGLYAVIGLGLSLVFGVMKLVNLAHGDLAIFSSYFAYVAMFSLGIDPILSLVLGMPILFAIGFGIQRFLMNRVFRLGMEPPLLIAFGISIILENIYLAVWTPLSRGLTTSYALRSYVIGQFHVPLTYVLDFTAALLVMVFLREFLRRTYLGRGIRAASQDWRAAQLMGIDTNRIYALTFGIAMIFAAIAGVFVGLTFPFTPTSGSAYLIIAFGVVIIGGLGSILGTFVGGVILGLAQILSGAYFGIGWQLFLGYVIILAILTARPQGIFGRR